MKLKGTPILALALALGACGQDSDNPPGIGIDNDAELTIEGEDMTGRTVVQPAQKEDIGLYLADVEGRALYMLEKEEGGANGSQTTSNCTGPCVEAWPPFTSPMAPQAVAEVRNEMLSTFTREDGTSQVAYNGHPLYYYHLDQEPGMTQGHLHRDGWGHWYLVSPSGQPIETPVD